MADIDEFEQILQDASEDEKESNTFKRLRKLVEKRGNEVAELREEISKKDKESRGTRLASVLEDLKVRPGLAKWYPADGEVTEDAVKQWLKDNAEDFNIDLNAGDGEGAGAKAEPNMDAESRDALARQQAAQRRGAQTGAAFDPDVIRQKFEAAKKSDDPRAALNKLYEEFGMTRA